jgi:hypothetical protein
MSKSIGTVARRAAAAVALIVSTSAAASAQREPLPQAPASGEFLSRYDFSMSAAALSNDDPRYAWDTHWLGEFDLVDYKYGRMTFLGDYQAVLGTEFRAFDPYQSNYTLEASGSVRAGRTEIVAILNHISRHLGDRDKRAAVAENSLGVRLLRRFEDRGRSLDVRVDLRKVIATAYVDYSLMGELDTVLRLRISEHTGVYGRIYGEGVTVDPAVANRNSQYSGRAELGMRLRGSGGVLELFGGAERVFDADPLDRMVATWPFVGFRIRTH